MQRTTLATTARRQPSHDTGWEEYLRNDLLCL